MSVAQSSVIGENSRQESLKKQKQDKEAVSRAYVAPLASYVPLMQAGVAGAAAVP
jgi:hypothetical protein